MSRQNAENVVWHEGHADRPRREALLDQKGVVVWFTGLSGSGKSTIAFTVEHALMVRDRLTYVLDGDNIRHGLNRNLGFSAQDRKENIRRIGEVSRLFADAGVLTLSSFVSPYRSDRDRVRALLDDGDFLEVFVNTPLEVCEQRDPKGLYKKARAGEIPNFTGISAPYEAPEKAELVVDSGAQSVEESVAQLLGFLQDNGYLKA